jgi:phosphoribosyl-ATP pyrophosphohydrolase
MIIPSIDIMGGRAVQLIGGKTFEMDCGDPLELCERYRIYGQIAVVDLDAALGRGDNFELILKMLRRASCRVGGGVRDADTLTRLLDAGAQAVMVGTKAEPEFLSAFPRERIIAALDGRKGKLAVEGWQADTGVDIRARLKELAPYAGGFLLTSIEREGGLGGLDLGYARDMLAFADELSYSGRLCFAGGVREAAEVAELDALGADVQAGMAMYKGILDPAEAFAACLRSDRPDGLWPTVVCDERGIALGLVYSDKESLKVALTERAGVYHSRTRGLWRKGQSSGNAQELLRVDADCDRDALRFVVRQNGAGFCHRGKRSCWAPPAIGHDDRADSGFSRLERTVAGRRAEAEAGEAPKASYSARLFRENGLLAAKLAEEAAELAEAEGPRRSAEEAADLIYFAAVKLAKEGSSLEEAERVLDERALRLTRRPGNAKRPYEQKGGEPWKSSIH